MFTHFWSLCLGCPNTGVNRLHTEYRSTYKWHECQGSSPHAIVRRAPASKGGVGLPGVGDAINRTRPNLPAPKTAEKVVSNGSADVPLLESSVTTTAPRSSHLNPLSGSDSHAKDPQTPRKSKSMGRIHGSAGGGGGGEAKEKWEPSPAPVKEEGAHAEPVFRGHRRVPSDGVTWRHSKALESEQGGMDAEDKFMKSTYKSEYRKKFRPFSQYQYSDGKFSKAKPDEPDNSKAWYKEVLELRKQAGQYRCRGWGVETASERMTEIYSKQVELWEQVSRRSSLQALSLASSAAPSRPISKAEKEIENSRRSSPLKNVGRERPFTAPSKPAKQAPIHSQKTGTDKVDQKPKETTPRHHYDRTTGTAGGRSISVGPENRSPKRISRPPAHVPAPAVKTERRPRPTSLSTNARRKGTDSTLPQNEKKATKKPIDVSGSPKRSDLKSREEKRRSNEQEAKKERGVKEVIKEVPAKEAPEKSKDLIKGKSTPEPRFAPEKYEPVVKTPPEPTRVKSPDQVLVKSPDPVNWTVPLDTGKTFTVTHNIPEGETSRGTPSSEHRPPIEPRSRQTPEPTRLYQGSLAGTPITTAGTVSSTQVAPANAPSAVHIPDTKASPSITDSVMTGSTYAAPAKLKDELEKKEDKPVPAKDLSNATKTVNNDESSANISTNGTSLPKDKIDISPLSQPKQDEPKETISNSAFGLSSGAQDPMTMSIYGSINGMNDKVSDSSLPKDMITSIHPTTKTTEAEARPIPTSSVRRLDDPLFLDNSSNPSVGHAQTKPTTTTEPSHTAPAPSTGSQPKSGGYRVLEDPSTMVDIPSQKPSPYRVLEAPTETPVKPKGSPYRILEAPDEPIKEVQPTGAVSEIKQGTLVSPSSGKTMTEALDKARNRFDSFWGGSKEKDAPSKV